MSCLHSGTDVGNSCSFREPAGWAEARIRYTSIRINKPLLRTNSKEARNRI